MIEQVMVERSSIMVVDDTPANLQVLSGMLRQQGYRVRPVPSGRLALTAARAEPPDLVLLDVNMPEMNGYEVSEQMREDEALRETPIIFVSALNETVDKVRAFRAGGVDYVTKPFNFEEVDARVRAHLELRRRRLDLERANQQLRDLERLRDGLIHMIVHDMRTPLTGLSGFLEILGYVDGTNLSEQGSSALGMANASAERLVDMVNAVLDVSKLESGTASLSQSRFDLRSAVEEVVASYLPEQQCDIRVEGEGGAPIWVKADVTLIKRVLKNLLTNACHATAEGGQIRVRLAATHSGVCIGVEDDGPPIPADWISTVFDKFGVLDARTEKRRYANGLGMAMCRMVVEAHGGRIGVHCDEPRGRRFWFSLPTFDG